MAGNAVDFECKRDDLTIRGKVFGDTSQKRPVVIMSHGFLADQKMCRNYACLLAEHGYISVTFDFCGGGISSSSDGRSEDMTIFSELKDLMAVIGHFKAEAFTEGISLLGCSQGGLVSAMAAKELENRIEKLVLMYPALCIPDDARKGKMLFYRFDPEDIPDVLGYLPMKLGGDYARAVISLDAYELIGGFDGPVLYLHGTKDRIVDISYARKAHSLYPNCEYHEIIGGGHIFKGQNERQAQALLADFMS